MNDKLNKTANTLRFLRYCTFLLSLGLVLFGKLTVELNVMLCGTLLLYTTCLLQCFERFRRRIVLFFFYVTFFVFLIARPTISMLRGDVWWHYGESATVFALSAVYFSLTCVYLGSLFVDKLVSEKGWFQNEGTPLYFDHSTLDDGFTQSLSFISAIGYYICLAFNMMQGMEKVAFVAAGQYTDIYTGFQTSLPFFVQAFGAMMPYFLCVHLACMPKKPMAFLALAMYVLSTVPVLLTGARNSVVLALIFAVVYFAIRDYLDGTQYWIGKFEKTCIIIALPLAIAFLGYYNYARDGTSAGSNSVMSLMVDFFYKQGVTFDVMCRSHNFMDALPDEVNKCYTFGGMIDYLKTNMFARELFGTVSLGEGNNAIKAIYGNSFAHSMSYVAEPDYLLGRGLGSSYILETFADFGYAGIGIFSFLLSAFMTVAVPLFKKGIFYRIFALNCFTIFFLIPRAEATGFLNFILYVQFWVVVLFCYVAAHAFKRDSTRLSAKYYRKRMMSDVQEF